MSTENDVSTLVSTGERGWFPGEGSTHTHPVLDPGRYFPFLVKFVEQDERVEFPLRDGRPGPRVHRSDQEKPSSFSPLLPLPTTGDATHPKVFGCESLTQNACVPRRHT